MESSTLLTEPVFFCIHRLGEFDKSVKITLKQHVLHNAELLEVHYSTAPKVCMVMDNLNTHVNSSLYEAFPPDKARALPMRLESHYTPKRGSRLNMAEIELSVMTLQCLGRRIPDMPTLSDELNLWNIDCSNSSVPIEWQFAADDARIKLKRLYPNI